MFLGSVLGNVSCREVVTEARYEWKVENLGSLIGEFRNTLCSYRSPAFVFLQRTFRLQLYPASFTVVNGKQEAWMGLFLDLDDSGPPMNIRYTLGIETASGETEVRASGTRTLHTMGAAFRNTFGSPKLIMTTELFRRRQQLMPLNVLTFTLTLKIADPHTDRGTAEVAVQTGAEDARVREAKEGRRDPEHSESAEAATQTSTNDTGIQEAVQRCQDPEYTDFAALCQNFELKAKDCDVSLEVRDKKFRVHKLILEERAPKLAAVISEHEVESETAVVCLKNCHPDAFQVFLRCVYSGGWENLNEKNVCEVYDIADKYDFLELKEACVRYMLSNLSPDSVCSVIDRADKHGEVLLKEKATDFLVANARLVFKTDGWKKFEVNNSLIAYHLYTRVYKNGK